MKASFKVQRIIVIIILVLSLLGFYYYLSNRNLQEKEEQKEEITKVQSLLMRDLENDYPPTPKEVIKYFSDISQCFYGETYTDEELEALAKQIRILYDSDLVVYNTWEQYFADLKHDIKTFKEKDIVIFSYAPSTSTDVTYFDENEYKCARLYCTYTLRRGTKYQSIREIFILRQDEDKHWKIYGWDLAENSREQ